LRYRVIPVGASPRLIFYISTDRNSNAVPHMMASEIHIAKICRLAVANTERVAYTHRRDGVARGLALRACVDIPRSVCRHPAYVVPFPPPPRTSAGALKVAAVPGARRRRRCARWAAVQLACRAAVVSVARIATGAGPAASAHARSSVATAMAATRDAGTLGVDFAVGPRPACDAAAGSAMTAAVRAAAHRRWVAARVGRRVAVGAAPVSGAGARAGATGGAMAAARDAGTLGVDFAVGAAPASGAGTCAGAARAMAATRDAGAPWVQGVAVCPRPAGVAAARAPIGRTRAIAGAAGCIGTSAVVCTPHDCHAGKHTTQHTSG
jgi:hypothetical protein